ncbi:IS6 family transposase [Bacillus sp. (in: firmicutes)]|uniref:IS6 family transposase n=1 Tax=Bacillus sp. TaxID=1409 RepID=UPI0039E4AC78
MHFAWHLDEIYIKIKGEWRYLYRELIKKVTHGIFNFIKKRDHQVAYAFMKRLVKTFREPTVLTTDKAPALLCACKKLKEEGFYKHTKHCTVKYLNNLIEQDHKYIKRRLAKSEGFQSIRHASRTLKGIETVHALYKKNRSLKPGFCFSAYSELQKLFIVA